MHHSSLHNTSVCPLVGPLMVAGQVAYFTSRTCFHPVCLHLRMNLFGRRLQELLLPEQAAAVYVVSGLCGSHKWSLELACKGSTHYTK